MWVLCERLELPGNRANGRRTRRNGMARSPLTVWEQAQLKGYSRRDFVQFCTWLAAAAGIEASAVGQVVHAMETKRRVPVVWFHFQEGTC